MDGLPMGIDWFPLWLSLRVAALSTLISLLAGLWLAWLFTSRTFRGKNVLEACITLPLVLPPTVLGYYLLVLLGRQSHVGKAYEWVFGAAAGFHLAGRRGGRAAPLRAAADQVLRAPLWRAWTAPYPKAARYAGRVGVEGVLARHAAAARWSQILAATALAFARSLGDFGITIMLAGNIPGRTQTISVAIYDAVEGGRGDVARILVLVISAIALVSLTLANRLGRLSLGKAG